MLQLAPDFWQYVLANGILTGGIGYLLKVWIQQSNAKQLARFQKELQESLQKHNLKVNQQFKIIDQIDEEFIQMQKLTHAMEMHGIILSLPDKADRVPDSLKAIEEHTLNAKMICDRLEEVVIRSKKYLPESIFNIAASATGAAGVVYRWTGRYPGRYKAGKDMQSILQEYRQRTKKMTGAIDEFREAVKTQIIQ